MTVDRPPRGTLAMSGYRTVVRRWTRPGEPEPAAEEVIAALASVPDSTLLRLRGMGPKTVAALRAWVDERQGASLAALGRRTLPWAPTTPRCDYCDEGLPLVGWHERVDPEGIEGVQRVPCMRAQP